MVGDGACSAIKGSTAEAMSIAHPFRVSGSPPLAIAANTGKAMAAAMDEIAA
jgi:hypothetical protein